MKIDFLTPREVADLLGVSPITVRQWANQGRLPSQRTAGGHRRFRREDVENFAREQGMLSDRNQGSRRLLVVEDDRQLAAYLAELLIEFADELETRFSADGFDAGRIVERWRPDIVLLDLMLPGVDGFDVCRNIRQSPHLSKTRVIAMTGYSTEENIKRALEAGAERCLAKPFLRVELLDAIGLNKEH